jgi:Holliday junction resolvasome RuvABC endonuclease subunit
VSGSGNVLRLLTMSRVLGIDPSLTSLGYAYFDDRGLLQVGRIKPDDRRGAVRLMYHVEQMDALLSSARPSLVAYEGYAMGRPGRGAMSRAFDLGELGGVLKLHIFSRSIPLLLVPPSCLKLFATGKGNADKNSVKLAMGKHLGRPFDSDDEADAYALLQLGNAFCDRRQRPRDPRHFRHTALRGCELVQAV